MISNMKDTQDRRGYWFFRGMLLMRGWNATRVDNIVQGWEDGTLKAYCRGWKHFFDFLEEEEVGLGKFADTEGIKSIYMDFLDWLTMETNEEDPRCPPYSFNSIKASLNNFMKYVFDLEMQNDAYATQLAKRWNKQHPIQPRHWDVWDAGVLLDYFRNLSITLGSPEKYYFYLQRKAAALLAFFCMLRPVETTRIVLDQMESIEGGLILRTVVKTNQEKHTLVFVPKLSDDRIYPCGAVTELVKLVRQRHGNGEGIHLFMKYLERVPLFTYNLNSMLVETLRAAQIQRYTAYTSNMRP
jgi:hypothetical protein